jgi:signal transduction histidine kinase/ActR/RegA family two-component response regulator
MKSTSENTSQQLMARIEYLEESRRFIQNALEMVLPLGDFQQNIYRMSDPGQVLMEAEKRIRRMIPFEARAMYLVNEETSEFEMAVCEPSGLQEALAAEVDFMIEKGFFAWALREKRGVTIASKDQSRQLVLHVIANYARIRGMFIGLMPARKQSIPDSSLTVLSIVLLNTANAIESLEFNCLLQKQKELLERTVEERTQKLLNSEQKLRQLEKMEVIGALAGGVAHDLNNILSGIVSYPELLLMKLPPDSDLRKPVQTIKKSGEKAATIVQDMLTMTRRGVAVKEVLSLNMVVREYLLSPEFQKMKSYHPKVQIRKELATDLLNLSGSPVHLSKTVMNLVSNAAEAQPEGGQIIITTENRYLDKWQSEQHRVKEGDYILLQVSDKGLGISGEDLDRIFEPFYTKKVMGRSGTGLGMAVVWGTVEDHDGYIDVHSVLGEGTTFQLFFPATRENITERRLQLPVESIMGHGEFVLIVDDVAEQREIASEMLKSLQYRVSAVASGEEAIQHVQDNRVDLLVLDMIMDPGIDGLETYRRILEIKPDQKAVIASGFSETDNVKAAQKLGAGAYVKKPYLIEKIGEAVRKELDQKPQTPPA